VFNPIRLVLNIGIEVVNRFTPMPHLHTFPKLLIGTNMNTNTYEDTTSPEKDVGDASQVADSIMRSAADFTAKPELDGRRPQPDLSKANNTIHHHGTSKGLWGWRARANKKPKTVTHTVVVTRTKTRTSSKTTTSRYTYE
jgi:hypothetical protein